MMFRSVYRPALAVQRCYHKNIVDHYNNPRNVGSFDKADSNVGTGLVGAPACGDVMKLQIKVDEVGNITDTCFKTFGCGSAIASSSLATEWLKNKNVFGDAKEITSKEIANNLNLPPVKLHCSMLAEDAIAAAIANIKSKKFAMHNFELEQQDDADKFAEIASDDSLRIGPAEHVTRSPIPPTQTAAPSTAL